MNRRFFTLRLFITLCVVVSSAVAAQTTTANGSVTASGKQPAAIEEAVKLETPIGNLHGTLLVPQAKSQVPVVLLIAGSGATDRDGNSASLKGPNNSLKLLAEGLAANGIASLRYDKRGIGESGKAMLLAARNTGKLPREAELSFDDFIADAMLWGQQLRNDKRFSSVTIAGHSEGSLIGMVAAKKILADAFISIAGAGRPVQQLLLEQLKSQLSPDLQQAAETIANQLAAGETAKSVPAALNMVFRPSIQPYMISWLRYDPAKEIAKLSIPVLITQGTTDLQTTEQDVKLLAAANPSARVSLIAGMNHVLKAVSGDRDQQVASYSDPTLPVMPSLINDISRFVRQAKK